MKMKSAACAAALSFTGSLEAHHSSSLFDVTTPIRLEGVIAAVHFANPHSFILVDVVGSDGNRVRWAVENSGTLAMTRQRGFGEETLQVGDPIEVCGYAPKRSQATAEEGARRASPRPAPWWGEGMRALTGRLLILKSGPAEHWSRYGPLEPCQALVESQ